MPQVIGHLFQAPAGCTRPMGRIVTEIVEIKVVDESGFCKASPRFELLPPMVDAILRPPPSIDFLCAHPAGSSHTVGCGPDSPGRWCVLCRPYAQPSSMRPCGTYAPDRLAARTRRLHDTQPNSQGQTPPCHVHRLPVLPGYGSRSAGLQKAHEEQVMLVQVSKRPGWDCVPEAADLLAASDRSQRAVRACFL